MKTRTAFEQIPITSLPPEVLAQACEDPETGRHRRVMVVDDHRRIADTVVETLHLNGYEARAAYTAEEGLALLPEFRPSIVISDVGLPNMDGITLGERIAAIAPKTQIILMCECLPRNPELVAWATLKKPFRASELLALIGAADARHG